MLIEELCISLKFITNIDDVQTNHIHLHIIFLTCPSKLKVLKTFTLSLNLKVLNLEVEIALVRMSTVWPWEGICLT